MSLREKKSSFKVVPPKSGLNSDLGDNIDEALSQRNFTAIIAGRPSSGKSSLMDFLLADKRGYNKVYDKVYLISPGSSLKCFDNSVWEDHPEAQIYDRIDMDVLFELTTLLEETRDEEKNSLVVMDDIQADLKKAGVERQLMKYFSNYRHLRTSFVILAQNVIMIPRQVRLLADYYFVFVPTHSKEYIIIKEEILSFLSRQQVKEVVDMVYTEPYTFLLVNKKTKQLYKNFNELVGEHLGGEV